MIVVNPTDSVTVHVPDDGNPLKATLPVDNKQVGCVMVPTIGAVGVAGCAVMTAFPDAPDVHPDELVTLNV